MNIYELKGAWKSLQAMIENGDYTEDELQDTIESLEFDIEEKAESYGLVMKNLEMLASGLDSESKRLMDRKRAIDKSIESMKGNLLLAMIETGKTKFKTEHFAFGTRKSKSVNIMVNVDELPSEVVKEKITKTADKTLIKKMLNDGQEVYGAEIVEKENLQIR